MGRANMKTKNYIGEAKKYARRVVSGKAIANHYVRVACQRFLHDISRKNFAWRMDKKRANHVCIFFEHVLKHVEGNYSGLHFKLLPFQVFFLVNIFGFMGVADPKVRRFQDAILFIARKNGKTTLSAGLAIYDMLYGEQGAQVYAVSTKRDQSSLAFHIAGEMIERLDEGFKKQFKGNIYKIRCAKKFSVFKPLANTSKTMDGMNPTLTIFDEAAAIEDQAIFDVMRTATGARKAFTNVYITTAQTKQTTPFFHKLAYAEKELDKFSEGKKMNERMFMLLYGLEDGDQWDDVKCWKKANPALGKSLYMSSISGLFDEAKVLTAERITFQTKHLNIWSRGITAWLDMADWTKCCNREIIRKGALYVTIDLSRTRDLTAVGMIWVWKGEKYYDYHCFYPRPSLEKLDPVTRSIFEQAHNQNKLTFLESKAIEHEPIVNFVKDLRDSHRYDVHEVGLDFYDGMKMQIDLKEEGFNASLISQKVATMSPVTKELERLIVNRGINLLVDPFLKWQAENCLLTVGLNDNYKVIKDNATNNKIDAIICLIMGLSLVPYREPEKRFYNFMETIQDGKSEQHNA